MSVNFHARKKRYALIKPFFFASFTNGISAFSLTCANVYSLTSDPFSNTVSRRSCPKRKQQAIKSCLSFRVCHWFATCFPALNNRHILYKACHWLHFELEFGSVSFSLILVSSNSKQVGKYQCFRVNSGKRYLLCIASSLFNRHVLSLFIQFERQQSFLGIL